jgi:Ca-activated chloride channel homolog
MTSLTDFSFAQPAFLWALIALPFLIALFFAAERHRRFALDAFIAARLQPRLAGQVSVTKRRWAFFLQLAAFIFAVLALAQPRWGVRWAERTSRGRDVIIAVDSSRSMLAQDLKPSRLERARLAAQDLLNAMDGDRVGLVAFAGTAFLQAPLTADYDAVRDALAEIDPDIIPRGGSNITAAIETADDAFGKGESQHRALIIFSDGEELEADALDAAKAAASKYKIFTVGLGSPQGSLIPVPNERGGTEFVRDSQGQFVTSRLDETRLREIAESTGGFYVYLQSGPAEMRRIVEEGLGKMKQKDSDSRFSKEAIERYHWPLATAVLLTIVSLLLGDRRRITRTAAAMVLAVFLFPSPASAAIIPQAEYNRGCEAFEKGDYSAAAQAFSTALGTGPAELQSKAAYNLANTLARRGAGLPKPEEKIQEWKNALQHYDRTLELSPGHTDAQFNRDLVKKAIEDLQKQQEQQQKDQQGDPENKKDDQEKKDEQKDGGDGKSEQQQKEGGESEKKDQSSSQQQNSESQNGNQKDQEQQQGKSGEDQKKEGEQKAAQGKEGEQKDGEQKQGEPKEGKNGEPKEREDGKSDVPQPEPRKDGEQKRGELKAGNPQNQPNQGDQPPSDAAQEMAAAAEGKLTEKQARALLQGIKDEKVRLLDPRELERQRVPPGRFKDW